ncbi:MAG: hypothetical protein EBV77_13900 [Gemmatimonadaceae bacterium]|nr:hypothetical protein [Gemmatimonadaceae bacterium]
MDGASIDLPAMMARKTDVVGQNTKGIEFLFRKHKITWAKGFGTLKPNNVIDVQGADGTVTSWQSSVVSQPHRLSTPASPPGLPSVP